jgi:SAM-dependent methyltransferase
MLEPDFDPRTEWEANAPAWIEMARAGADRYRDLLNTPAFFGTLPPVEGVRCLDVGCGEGHNTRLLAEQGAEVTAVDITPSLLTAAASAAPGIRHLLADGAALPFGDASFDLVTAFMSLMDMTDPFAGLAEMARVVRPGGIVQFSTTHPVNTTPTRSWVHDDAGERIGVTIAGYFVEGPVTESWTFGSAPEEMRDRHRPFTITSQHLTVSSWLNGVIGCGLTIERVVEPVASEELADSRPEVADTRILPYFLIVQARR